MQYVYNGTPALIKQAQAMIAEGRGEDILTRTWDVAGSTPVTARRYASFTVKGGDDDMFSSDLTDIELKVSPLTSCCAAQLDLFLSHVPTRQAVKTSRAQLASSWGAPQSVSQVHLYKLKLACAAAREATPVYSLLTALPAHCMLDQDKQRRKV